MKISGDMAVKLTLGIGALVAGYLVFQKVSGAIGAAVPQVVKDGAQAAGQLGQLAVRIVAHPLEQFGVTPPADGSWVPTVPWEENAPPVDDTILDARDAMARAGSGFAAPDAGYYKKYADPLVTDDGMDFRYFSG